MRARRLTVCGPQGRGSTPCRARSTVSIGEPLSRPPRTSMLDEHRPERAVLLAVNQEFGEPLASPGARSSEAVVLRRGDGVSTGIRAGRTRRYGLS